MRTLQRYCLLGLDWQIQTDGLNSYLFACKDFVLTRNELRHLRTELDTFY